MGRQQCSQNASAFCGFAAADEHRESVTVKEAVTCGQQLRGLEMQKGLTGAVNSMLEYILTADLSVWLQGLRITHSQIGLI